jgi:formylglycine-generating enzyme required for sulfatase activity
MNTDPERSLSDEATSAGRARPQRADVSLGDQRTLGDNPSGQDTVIDDIEVIDLESRYTMEGTLGQGGMGAVLLATDTRLDRKVAIKRILGEAADNRMAVQRFLTEAKSIAALNHPNIVQIYDYGRAKDGPFLIMEYVDGGSLLDRCRESALPLEEAIALACQLCDGLAKAHDLGIVHRDIKPANVLLTKDGIPKLTDFGLAKAQAGDHGQTMTGAVLGTPDFMPPEQRKDAALVDHRSDLWSLAATVYQMVTGRSPKIIRFDLLPAELTKVLGKALEDAKQDRYQAARELRDALKASLRAATPHSPLIAEGQCPSCGVHNESSRRFCRGCGGALEAPCLSCDMPMTIGDEICGSCGAKQTPLLEARESAMAAEQAKAEGLLGDFLFDEATQVATQLRDEPHSRLSHLKAWAEAFLVDVEKAKNEQYDRASAAVAEALAHEKAYDYEAGIRVIEPVPETIRTQPLPGNKDTAGAVLVRLTAKLVESRALETAIRTAIKSRELTGLKRKVLRFMELRPDRTDIAKLRRQLDDRAAAITQRREVTLQQAREARDRQDYATAIKLLSQIDPEAVNEEVEKARRSSEALQDQALTLRGKIKAAVAANQHDGLLAIIDEYLAIKPSAPDLDKLRAHLVLRSEQMAAEAQTRVRRTRIAISAATSLLLLCGLTAAVVKGWEFASLRFKEANAASLVKRVVEHVNAGRLTDAETDFATAVTTGVGDLLLTEPRKAMAAAWSSRAAEALSNGQAEEVRQCCIQAERYGASLPQLRNLRAEACRLDAIEALRHEDYAKATRACTDAGQLNPDIFGALMADPRAAGIKPQVASILNAQFDKRAGEGAYAEAMLSRDLLDRADTAAARRLLKVVAAFPREYILLVPPIRNSIGMQLKLVPPGSFMMGKQDSLRKATISQCFYIGVHEVTNEQYETVTGKKLTKRVFEPEGRGSWTHSSVEAKHPVECVSWFEASDFCTMLSESPAEREAGCRYRLPTEQDWEYACRGDGITRFAFGDHPDRCDHLGWHKTNSSGKTHPVGSKEPNAWGLYDMHGNVSEWCQDIVDTQLLGERRAYRGGGWDSDKDLCGCDTRNWKEPHYHFPTVGFRVVMVPDGER